MVSRMPFSFDPTTGRYRDAASGQFIREAPIRAALDQVIDAQALEMRTLSQTLIEGRLSLAAWQSAMMQAVKASQLVGAASAVGGWNEMDQAWFGWTGQRIRTQYAFLGDFAAQIANGKQPLNGTVLARATMYAEAARATNRAAERRSARQRGLEMEKNVLGSADHCGGCLSATAAGWVEIGTLTPIGGRQCRSRCRCSMIYRVKRAA